MPTVLLVDDDVDLVQINKLLLEKEGFTVLVAYDGEECKAKALEARPDVIVLDVMMKTDTEGIHVARELRAREETKTIPIVMLTAVKERIPWRFEADKEWLPVDDFLAKPATPKLLIDAIRQVLNRKEG
ncbi:MAG: response regulator [Planctomycetota bacterium]|nr:response regulator [Planctomycetota bacterium]